jgi:uncharacterized protein with PIN domain
LKLLEKLKKFGAQALPVESVDDTTKAIRLAICRGDKDNFDPEEQKCLVCGCFMEIKAGAKTHINPAKLRVEITHCPNGLWGDIETANYYQSIDKT